MIKKGIGWVLAFFLLVAIFTYKTPEHTSWTAWSLPLAGTVIAIDPGHGGIDGGAVSKDGKIVEKEVSLPISMYLRDFLQESGAYVIMTREEDKDLAPADVNKIRKRKTEDLRNRVKFVNANAPDFLVSIHLNSIPSPKWSGAQTFYYPAYKESGELAGLIQDEIKRVMENTDRVPKKTDDVYLIREVSCPAVLVEVGFLSNTKEAKQLQDTAYQKAMANAIYQGILRHFAGEKITNTP
ncbi:N-acetylmuramoyl-L-alanine amidase CwlD [Brevibacillus fluminis]|uniref:N-acetylmuramoyl-L-alanine amidase CwlD n=1 Tax=Brevibacillus fluminis TaxID=511487 RepID=A0A3M8CW26_9BACL|nr:N-acetylmuramoyl-L-alanine amidase CwlD [Brevibacillus fluminis]RNB79025.1 N-acetylmuramoyl-L-alanine amidase CwlD [Brevibacillus fluminis]